MAHRRPLRPAVVTLPGQPAPEGRKAVFLDRPNRFVLRARLDGRTVRAALPNPGRLGELLLPGVEVRLVGRPPGTGRKTRFTAVAVRRGPGLRLLDTHRSNDVAASLLRERAIAPFAGARIVRREFKVGRSRFDFLLEEGGSELVLEVKSCNLVERRLALFPDAATERGRRHVDELAALARRGGRAALLFLVHDPSAHALLPNVHTDLPFARTLFDAARRFPGATEGRNRSFRITAASIRLNEDLSVGGRPRPVPIPIARIEGEMDDRGAYLILLRLGRKRRIDIGALGPILFAPGFYVYAGSAERNLGARIARHRRLRKKLHWHIDHLRRFARFVEAFPVRSSRRDECDLARGVERIGGAPIDRFGASDCRCRSHLFHFPGDPRLGRPFQDLLSLFRHRWPGR